MMTRAGVEPGSSRECEMTLLFMNEGFFGVSLIMSLAPDSGW